jgi:hypothetical protein
VGKIIWTRRAAALSAAVTAALWIHGCGPAQQAPNAPVVEGTGPISPECHPSNKVELLLSDLVPVAGVAFGSISPFIYEVAEGGVVSFAPNAIVKDESAAQKARELLDRVNRNPAAQKTFGENVARSQAACGGGKCPQDAPYTIREIERVASHLAGLETVRYSFGGGEPNQAEKEAFLGLMKSGNPSCPPAVEASFHGNELLLKRRKLPKDCHPKADDGHLNNACTTENVPDGIWRLDESDPRRPRHCCMSE